MAKGVVRVCESKKLFVKGSQNLDINIKNHHCTHIYVYTYMYVYLTRIFSRELLDGAGESEIAF